MSTVDELLREFVIESNENLETIDRELMALEREPENPEVLASVFRAMHTIKGTAGFFDLPAIERLAHSSETLLGLLRDGEMVATVAHITVLLIVADALRTQLAALEETGTEADLESDDLIATIEALCNRGSESDSTPTAPATLTIVADTDAAAGAPEHSVPDAAPSVGTSTQPSAKPAPAATDRPSAAETSIRVDTGVLDDLMTLMGELVLARNELLQTATRIDDAGLGACAQRLNHITSDLRARVLKTRMRPVNAVWSAIPRLARDTALACAKQVVVRMEGEETELDKTVLEAIKDPLTHCVRNSVDHGIESPEARLAAGKPAEGVVTLRARHENGNVVVEIGDDGAGINVERVRAKALEQGLHTEAELDAMSDRQVADLIFSPGFSTAAQVTNVSGRGVGMDVVRTNVERIGGTADVSFVAGRGSTFTITVPLTLAIIPALIVGCGGERFAIPQTGVIELVRAKGDGSDIENLDGALVYRLRGQLLPLVNLREVLGFESSQSTGDRTQIAVLQGTGSPFGLIVESILGNEEIVVRPLDAHYAANDVFAGATVMGDGRVALILDVPTLGSTATDEQAVDNYRDDTETVDDAIDVDLIDVLLVETGDDRRIALQLDQVARLEKFLTEDVEQTGTQRVVQYRGDVLPLVGLSELLGLPSSFNDRASKFVVAAVVAHNGVEIGLEVSRIVEVSTARAAEYGDHNATVRTAIVDGAVIDVVSLDALLQRSAWALGVAA